MFGYIRPDYGELKTKHVALYRSVYCGICRTSGKRISKTARFLLNYDFVFLAVVRLALTKEKFKITPRRCVYTLKKRGVMEPNQALEFTSAAFGALMYYKVLDDRNDEKGFKRFSAKLKSLWVKPMAKKAERLHPGICETVRRPLEKLSELEKQKCGIPDQAADAFAVLTGNILSFGMEGTEKRVAYDIGYHVGRFVYLADAYDDSEKDWEKGSYNPFNLCYGSASGVIENKEFVHRTLLDSAAAMSRSYALLDGSVFDDIIYNVASWGCEAVADKVINKENDK